MSGRHTTREVMEMDDREMADRGEATSAPPSDDEREQPQTDDEREDERAKEELEQFAAQDELPADPREWPGGKARFKSFGKEGEPYGEGETQKLGPPEVVHHDDGSVSVGGERVEDPDRYKGEPIPGGPTDPNAPD